MSTCMSTTSTINMHTRDGKEPNRTAILTAMLRYDTDIPMSSTFITPAGRAVSRGPSLG